MLLFNYAGKNILFFSVCIKIKKSYDDFLNVYKFHTKNNEKTWGKKGKECEIYLYIYS